LQQNSDERWIKIFDLLAWFLNEDLLDVLVHEADYSVDAITWIEADSLTTNSEQIWGKRH
jgi:hypothetical protein